MCHSLLGLATCCNTIFRYGSRHWDAYSYNTKQTFGTQAVDIMLVRHNNHRT